MKNRMISLGALLVFTVLFHFGCNSPTNSEEQDEIVDMTNVNIENYPRIDGSTSAHPLQVVIACRLLGVSYYWETWFDGTERVYPTSTDTSKSEVVLHISRTITHNGTHSAYVNLILDSADVIIVARTPSDDELNLADSVGVELDVTSMALDAFVFIVNAENAITSLTIEQVQQIYTGTLTNWEEVGGTEALIQPYQRNANSGSQELMLNLVMDTLPMINAPDMILVEMMGPINKISEDPFGLGYTVYYFKQFMAPSDRLKMIGINGVQPNYENIQDSSYVYTTKVYAAIRKNLDPKSTAYQLYSWLITKAGQEIVKESGYVPIREDVE